MEVPKISYLFRQLLLFGILACTSSAIAQTISKDSLAQDARQRYGLDISAWPDAVKDQLGIPLHGVSGNEDEQSSSIRYSSMRIHKHISEEHGYDIKERPVHLKRFFDLLGNAPSGKYLIPNSFSDSEKEEIYELFAIGTIEGLVLEEFPVIPHGRDWKVYDFVTHGIETTGLLGWRQSMGLYILHSLDGAPVTYEYLADWLHIHSTMDDEKIRKYIEWWCIKYGVTIQGR